MSNYIEETLYDILNNVFHMFLSFDENTIPRTNMEEEIIIGEMAFLKTRFKSENFKMKQDLVFAVFLMLADKILPNEVIKTGWENITKYFEVYESAYNFLLDWGVIEKNPVKKIIFTRRGRNLNKLTKNIFCFHQEGVEVNSTALIYLIDIIYATIGENDDGSLFYNLDNSPFFEIVKIGMQDYTE